MNIELLFVIAIAAVTLITAITSYQLSTSDISKAPARLKKVRRIFYIELLTAFLLTIGLYLISEQQKRADKKEAQDFLTQKLEAINHVFDSLGIRVTNANTIVVTDTFKLQKLCSSTTTSEAEPPGGPGNLPPESSDSSFAYLEERVDEELPTSECRTHGINMNECFGRYKLINRFTEPILLYEVSNGFVRRRRSIMISPGGVNMTPLIRAGYHNNDNCEPGAEEHKFYFRTTSTTDVKYGAISLSTYACKIRTKVISPRNFYLERDGEKSDN